jgi:hypothetical protein
MSTQPIDLAELAAMAKPLRAELSTARHEVVRLIHEASDAPTREERLDARQRLVLARAHRATWKRLLVAIQAVLDGAGEPETCRTVDVDGTPVLIHGSGEMTEQDVEYFTQIVRAAIAKAKADEIGGVK